MTTRYQAITGAAILALSAPFTIAADEAWTMDFAAAKATATESDKDLLLEFTGSDWCPPCQRLNRDVFSKEAFLTAAPEHFVLVKLDFPQDKSGLTEEIQEQNAKLAEQYGVEGFPTIMLSDAKGRPYASTGFREGGPEDYVAHLESLRENRTRRDEAFASAEQAEGVEKAKALVAALNTMDLQPAAIDEFYGDVVESIKASDPDDETGFTKQSAARQRVAEFQEEIQVLAAAGNFDAILLAIDDVLKTEGLEPEVQQEITLTRALLFAEIGRFDEAIQVVDEAGKIAPDSDIVPHLDGFKAQLIEARDAAQTDE